MPSPMRLIMLAGGLVASVFAVRKFRGGSAPEAEAPAADLSEEEPQQAAEGPEAETEQSAEEEPAPEEQPAAEEEKTTPS